MPQTVRIENMPDDLMEELSHRARQHRRSLEAEIVAYLSGALRERDDVLTPMAVLQRAKRAGLSTPREAVRMMREDRDAR